TSSARSLVSSRYATARGYDSICSNRLAISCGAISLRMWEAAMRSSASIASRSSSPAFTAVLMTDLHWFVKPRNPDPIAPIRLPRSDRPDPIAPIRSLGQPVRSTSDRCPTRWAGLGRTSIRVVIGFKHRVRPSGSPAAVTYLAPAQPVTVRITAAVARYVRLEEPSTAITSDPNSAAQTARLTSYSRACPVSVSTQGKDHRFFCENTCAAPAMVYTA